MIHQRNPQEPMVSPANLDGWDSRRTAILVIHGIGDIAPLETLDDFGRTLVETLASSPQSIQLTHRLVSKAKRTSGIWFDQALRLQRPGAPADRHLDLYEYYWADRAEHRVPAREVPAWVAQVTRAAQRFYQENAELAVADDNQGPFTRGGRFQLGKYRLLIGLVRGLGALVPWLFGRAKQGIEDILSGIVVYSSADRRSPYYQVRKDILDGAVKAFRYLLEPDASGQLPYDRVILVGHSLGSQVGYDAVNRVVHEVNEGRFLGWDSQGKSTLVPGLSLDQVFRGFVTFGSPLDKIALFLRDQIPPEAYLRRQMIAGFHAFKQRDWTPNWAPPYPVAPPFQRLLETVPWRNYFDPRDAVSDRLEFYQNLTNVDAQLPPRWFTHNDYWTHRPMFVDIVAHFLL